MPSGRVYNLKRDDVASPDRINRKLMAPPGIVLPPKATTSQWMGFIGDQKQKGSCTGQMGREIRDLNYRKLYLFEKNRIVPPAQFKSSADFIYLSNLQADGDLGQDAGSTIHQTFITLNQKGTCLESQDPYSDTNVSKPPTPLQCTQALVYKLGPYHNLPGLLEIKACIASGYSCGFGINVYESFEGNELAQTGIMPMPKPNEALLGGHAQHCLDYDDAMVFPNGNTGGLLIQNSWGSNWGRSAPGRNDRGCYWMPYAFVNGTDVNDIWMIHEGKAWG